MFSVDGCLLTVLLLSAAGYSSQDCLLPEPPPHGRYEPYEDDCPKNQSDSAVCRSVPGTSVRDGWLLLGVCEQGYLPGKYTNLGTPHVCSDGVWSPASFSCVYDLGSDLQKCRLPYPPANGKYDPLALECGLSDTSSATPGTVIASNCALIFSCDKGYQLPYQELQVLVFCVNSTWHPRPADITCEPAGSSLISSTTPVSVSTTTGCVLPALPTYRKFCSLQCTDCSNCPNSVGAQASGISLKVQCASGYGLSTVEDFTIIGCVGQTWVRKIPECLRECPPLESDSMHIQCFYHTTSVDCSRPMLPGTTAKFQCRPSHNENPILAKRGEYRKFVFCKKTGQWSSYLPECEPDCGISQGNLSYTPAIVDGKATMVGEFPWHAGLYIHDPANNTFRYSCGGSLISNHIVLTAAHCVENKTAHDVKIAVGKYYQTWDHEESTAVKRNVSVIRIPDEYSGSTGIFAWDIALLMLSEKVKINNVVMPVCRNPGLSLDDTLNSTAYVVGWGRTSEGGKGSETLLSNVITIRAFNWCKVQFPAIQKYEKFCGTKGTVSVVQKGDSGGGLTVVDGGQHVIVGIVSVRVTSKAVSLFTNVSWAAHRTWIERQIQYLEELSFKTVL